MNYKSSGTAGCYSYPKPLPLDCYIQTLANVKQDSFHLLQSLTDACCLMVHRSVSACRIWHTVIPSLCISAATADAGGHFDAGGYFFCLSIFIPPHPCKRRPVKAAPLKEERRCNYEKLNPASFTAYTISHIYTKVKGKREAGFEKITFKKVAKTFGYKLTTTSPDKCRFQREFFYPP